ncbi:MAG: hypothetical protein K2Q34_01105 [Alphaproteobacteria bacterium]|nr:hypothetical protein [Alphaproteobacteria bacterium]
MKNSKLGLILYLLITVFFYTSTSIGSVAVMSGEEENRHKSGQFIDKFPVADPTEKGTASLTPRVETKAKPVSHKSEADQISELVSRYRSEGMAQVAAMLKATKEVKASKETPLEKELRALGCVQWGEIKELTREIVDEVKGFYNPTRGPFILKPGLQIVYENEVS